ncbi:MAG TPA: hypothetical protein VFI84_00540 [Candidatus Saccharimonadales bacterium]|nr:hypothetical protein [Candidatus Saccharimonadales bacterium]
MHTTRTKVPQQRTASPDVIDLVAEERRNTGYHPTTSSTHRLIDNGDGDLRWVRKVRHHQRHDTIDLRDRTSTWLQGFASDLSDMVDDGMSWVEEVFGPPVAVDLP